MANPLTSLATKLYSFAFFDALILIYPLYTLLFTDKGLSPARISSLLIAWSATIFLLELPSGALADILSRKKVLLIGIAAKIVGYGFWLFMPSYFGFLIGIMLWGVKSAFTLGAQEALVYEELKLMGYQALYAKVTGRMKALNSLGIVLSGLGAGLLASHGYNLILILSIGSMVFSGIALLSVRETPLAERTQETLTGYTSYLKAGIRLILGQHKILYMVLFMTLVFGLGVIDEFFSLFFRDKGLSNTAIALWIGAVYLAGGIGNVLAHRLDGKRLPVIPSLFAWAVAFIVATLVPAPFASLLMCLYMFYFSGLLVLIQTYLQREISDSSRATTLSIVGISVETLSLSTYLAIGLLVHGDNYSVAFQLVAAVAAIGGALLWGGFRQVWLVTHHRLEPAHQTVVSSDKL